MKGAKAKGLPRASVHLLAAQHDGHPQREVVLPAVAAQQHLEGRQRGPGQPNPAPLQAGGRSSRLAANLPQLGYHIHRQADRYLPCRCGYSIRQKGSVGPRGLYLFMLVWSQLSNKGSRRSPGSLLLLVPWAPSAWGGSNCGEVYGHRSVLCHSRRLSAKMESSRALD